MATHWSIPLILTIVTVVQARSPGLYWPTGSGDEHSLQTRTHLNDNALNGLNENELETLLYLLDRVDHPRSSLRQQQDEGVSYAHPRYDSRNKRTGQHGGLMQKKAVDWSDYWGIDKREVKPTEIDKAPSSINTKPLPDAKNDNEREEILKEFYENMAMAGNVKRRKREIRGHPSLEKDMKKVGDNLIWDALKLTGAHRDQKMSKNEFKQFKKELVKRIGAAYDLEKLRHVFEGNISKFSNKIGQ